MNVHIQYNDFNGAMNPFLFLLVLSKKIYIKQTFKHPFFVQAHDLIIIYDIVMHQFIPLSFYFCFFSELNGYKEKKKKKKRMDVIGRVEEVLMASSSLTRAKKELVICFSVYVSALIYLQNK